MRSVYLTASLLLFGLIAPGLRAQEAPSPSGPPPASDAAPPPADDEAVTTLKQNVNLVDLYFTARDKQGFITNLAKIHRRVQRP